MNEVMRRVQIVPHGYEIDRVCCPAIELDAERIIMIGHTDRNYRSAKCEKEVTQKLNSRDIKIETRFCNIFEMADSFDTILKETLDQRGNDVKVNVSSGSKITAIAGMLACMFADADPIYVHPDGYGEEGEIAVSHGMQDYDLLPTYPITQPDYQLISVLQFIYENQPEEGYRGVSLKEIGNFLLRENLPAVHGIDREEGEGDQIYKTIHSKIITPLSEQQLIHSRKMGGSDHVRTTQEGERMLALGQIIIEHMGF